MRVWIPSNWQEKRTIAIPVCLSRSEEPSRAWAGDGGTTRGVCFFSRVSLSYSFGTVTVESRYRTDCKIEQRAPRNWTRWYDPDSALLNRVPGMVTDVTYRLSVPMVSALRIPPRLEDRGSVTCKVSTDKI